MEIVILVVNYNSWNDVYELLESANSLKLKPKFLILDNKSNDRPKQGYFESFEQLKVEVVYLEKNYGYMGAICEYLRVTPNLIFDWLFISNADIIFSDPYVFNKLTLINTERESCGVSCPSVLSSITKKNQNPFLSIKPTNLYYYKYKIIFSHYWAAYIYYFLYKKKSLFRSKKNERVADGVETIFAPHGAFFGLSSLFFQRGGYVENRMFLFNEEEIIGYICSNIGLKVIHDRSATVVHNEHTSTGIGFHRNKYDWKKSSLKVLKEYMFD